jgi:hypothetical protein
MSLPARKSDLTNHLSRVAPGPFHSPDLPTAGSNTEEFKDGTHYNRSAVDLGERPSSGGVYAPNPIVAQN